MNFADFIAFLIEKRAPNLPLKHLGELIDSLIWMTADNGDEICRVRDNMLRSGQKEKVEIALNVRNVFPFETYEEMESELSRIAIIWPEFSDLCNDIILNRRNIETR